MINKIKLLRNIGQFDSVSAENLPLKRLTLVHAENGRGKTTLAAIMRSLSTGDPMPILERKRLASLHPPHVVVSYTGGPSDLVFENSAWNYILPNLVVFDDAFVDQNVYSGLAVGSDHRQNLHELVLGETGVTLHQQLQTQVEQVEKHGLKIREYEAKISRTERHGLPVDDFCVLRPVANVDREIQAAEQSLAASKQQGSIQNAQNFQEIILPEIDLRAISAALVAGIESLDAATVARIQEHLRTVGEDAEAWVSKGMKYQASRSEKESRKCVFCAQDLSGSPVFVHYRAYFGDEYRNHQQMIRRVFDEFKQAHSPDAAMRFAHSVVAIEKSLQFWSQFANLPDLSIESATVTEAWASVQEQVTEELRKKKADPLTAMQISESVQGAVSTYEHHRRKIDALKQQIASANTVVQAVRKKAKSANFAQIESALNKLRATKVRYTQEVVSLCDAYSKEKQKKSDAAVRRDQYREQLDGYRNTVFPAHQEAINRYLQKINAGYHLDEFKSANIRGGSTCIYNVVVNDTPVAVTSEAHQPGEPDFKNVLSAGDRNALAFAFFLAKLECEQVKDSKIVIIDDPITSLDEYRSLVTVQELRGLIDQVSQMVVLSHNKEFLCKIWDGTQAAIRAAFCVVRNGKASTINKWDVTQEMITENDLRHATMREYVENGGQNEREIAHSIRPMLEAFLRVAYPKHFPPGALIGGFQKICRGKMGKNDEILSSTDLNELREVNEYAKQFHHISKSSEKITINSDELVSFAKRTLAFTRRPRTP